MNEATALRIQIKDTALEEDNIIFEKTRLENPRLKYNGEENKFNNIHTSELSFNMLVKTADHGVFFHLFTGDEKRFKVVVDDVSDPENIATVWQGFLLPEQAREPYIYKDFFVDFLATDGIGRLKSEYLNNNYYRDNQSVLSVIFSCLLKTGLQLPLLFAPAIENAGFNLSYKDLDIQTKCYNNDGDFMSVYDILTKCLHSVGCKLFQYQNQWIVVGLNRINHDQISFEKFSYSKVVDGNLNSVYQIVYDGDVVLSRNIVQKPFLASPILDVIPELRAVKTVFENKNNEYLLPQDLISHLPVNIENDPEDRTLKYFNLQTNKGIVFKLFWFNFDQNFDVSKLNLNQYYNGLVATPNALNDQIDASPGVFFQTAGQTITEGDLAQNYGYLKDAFFVEASDDPERFATLEIESFAYKATGVTDQQLRDAIENEDLLNHFFFAITYKRYKNQPIADEELYLSNFANPDIPAGFYDFKLTVENGAVKAALKIEKIMFTKTGYYNLRVYPVVSNALFSGLHVYTKYGLTIKSDDEEVVEITKNVQFSSVEELQPFHADSEMGLSDRTFVFSQAILDAAAAGTLIPLQVQVVPIAMYKTPFYTNGVLWYHLHEVLISEDDFVRINNGYKIFVSKNGTGPQTELTENTFSVSYNTTHGSYVISQLNFVANSGSEIYIEDGDDVFLRINTDSTNTIDYAQHWLRKWRRFGVVESITFLEALTRIYHGCLSEYNYTVNGTIGALLTPFDLVEFHYKGVRRFNPISLDLNLNGGTTDVFMIESKYTDISVQENVVETESPVVTPTVVPQITIEAQAVAPSSFVYNWIARVSYLLTGLNPVNAVLTAKQFSDTIANGGVASGFEKSQVITSANGAFDFVFDITKIEVQRGWYQIQMEQNGVLSNVVEVEIAPVVAVPSQRIELTVVDIGDVLNVNGRYAINYIGFTPTAATQTLQKFDVVTQLPDGAPTVTAIDVNATEIDVAFPSSGAWQITVQADGYESNVVAWFSVQI